MPNPLRNRLLLFGKKFSPLNISNCELYLNYKVSSSLTIGTGLSQWSDLSTAGRNLIQATGSAQPILDTNGVLFDGVNDVLEAGSFSCTNGYTFFIISKIFATGGTRSLFSNGDGSAGFSLRMNNQRNLVHNGVAVYGFNVFSTTNYEIICASWSPATQTLNLYVNNVLVNSYSVSGINNPVAKVLSLGNRNTTGEFINTSVKGVLCYSKPLTLAEIQNNFNFLNKEFSIY